MKLAVEINSNETVVTLPDGQGKITVSSMIKAETDAVNLYLKDGKLTGVQNRPKANQADGVIHIEPTQEQEAN